MNKKILGLTLLGSVLLGTFTASGQALNRPSLLKDQDPIKPIENFGPNRDDLREERFRLRREFLEKDYKDGLINDEDYRTWSEHFEYMEDFHRSNPGLSCCGRGQRSMGRHYRNRINR